jgi:hypothetical protein
MQLLGALVENEGRVHPQSQSLIYKLLENKVVSCLFSNIMLKIEMHPSMEDWSKEGESPRIKRSAQLSN